MSRKELKEDLNKINNEHNLNLEITEDMKNICIKTGVVICAYANKIMPYFMNTDAEGMYYLGEEARREVLDALYRYAKKSFKERQEEKKYYLRHRFLEPNYSNYLNFEHLTQDWSLSTKLQDEEMQTQFTQKEIDVIKKEYNVDLKDFEIVEVE